MVRCTLHILTEPKPAEQTWAYAYFNFSLDYVPLVRGILHENRDKQGLLYTLEDSVLETYPEAAGLLLKFKINTKSDYSIRDSVGFLMGDINTLIRKFNTLPRPSERTRIGPGAALPGFPFRYRGKNLE